MPTPITAWQSADGMLWPTKSAAVAAELEELLKSFYQRHMQSGQAAVLEAAALCFHKDFPLQELAAYQAICALEVKDADVG